MTPRVVNPIVVKLATASCYGPDGVEVVRPGLLFDQDAELPDGCWRYALADANAGAALLGSDQFGGHPHMTDAAAGSDPVPV